MTLSRDAATGLLSGTALGVVTTSHGYNGFGELASMTAAISGTPIWEVAYTRDQLGRITTKVETIQGATDGYVYRYDLAGRLEEVEVNGLVTATYTFDANGNRLTKTTPGGTETGSYDAQDRLLAYDGTTFTSTRNGELATATDAGGTTDFTYDVFGNLLEVAPPSGPEIEYIVDARNRRIGKKLDGTLVQGLLWQSQLAPIAELDGSGAIVSRFVHATRVNVPDYLIRDGATYRILADHLGSPRLVVDTATGAVVQRMDFDEWGVVLADTNPGWTPFGFAGGLYEPASGLVRFGARDFDARQGRWLAKDPIGFAAGETDLLGYASNDPINGTDPSGMYSPEGHFSITMAAARAAGLSFRDALRLAWDVAAADWRPSLRDSQDPRNAYWHAMCEANTDPSICQQLFDDLVWGGRLGDCSAASLAQRLHALQDSFAWGHKGMQDYDGSLLGLPPHHLLGDWIPVAPRMCPVFRGNWPNGVTLLPTGS